MTNEKAIEIVQSAAKEQFGMTDEEVFKLSSRTELKDLGDSLEAVELTMVLEDYVGDVFPKDLSQFKTVGDLINFIIKFEAKK